MVVGGGLGTYLGEGAPASLLGQAVPRQLTSGILSKEELPAPLGPVWSLSRNIPEGPSRQSLVPAPAHGKSLEIPFPQGAEGAQSHPGLQALHSEPAGSAGSLLSSPRLAAPT